MNEAVNIVFGNGFRYSFGAFNMNIFKIKVSMSYQQEQLVKSSEHTILCRVVSSNKIVNDIRMSNAFFEGRRVSEIIFLYNG